MFKVNEDKSIHITRGDAGVFDVSAENGSRPYMFQPGDVIRVNVFERKDCDSVVLQKDFPVEAETSYVRVYLTSEETKIGETINKPKAYWYEIVLNPDTYPQTIVGYDDYGAKLFTLYPEGNDTVEEA